MVSLRILIPASPPQVSRSRGVGVTYKFVKRSMIPRVNSGINSRANIFDDSNVLDKFQDNRLKNYHPHGVTLPILYAVHLRCEG